ncbi:MAG: two-component regulator propeller domain-containing protein [Anaerolineales bacterium]
MPKVLKALSVVFFMVLVFVTACSITPGSKPTASIPATPIPLKETVVPETKKEPAFEIQYPNWTSFTNANTIQELVFDPEGYLWAVGDGGAVKWDLEDGTYKKITSEYGLAENHLTSLAIAPDGSLWFGTDANGVSRFNGQEWSVFTVEDGLISNAIHDIAIDQGNGIWAATQKGASYFDGSKWATYTTNDGLLSNMVYTILVDSKNTVWFGTNAGLCALTGDVWTYYTIDDGLAGNLIRSITEDSNGSIWVGTQDGGYSHIDGENWVTFTESDGLPSNWIYSITEGPYGIMWISTRGGLVLDHGRYLAEYENNLVTGKLVTTVVFEEDGAPVVGTADSGIYRLSKEKEEVYLTQDTLTNNNIKNLGVTTDGSMMTVTEDGRISVFRSDHWEVSSIADPNNHLIQSGPRESLWFQLQGGGIEIFNGESWKSYSSPDLAGNLITSVTRAADKSIWITTSENGVYQLIGDRWTHFTSTDGLAHDRVTCSGSYPDGSLWFGTEAFGVSRYQDGTWTSYTTEDGLIDDAVFSISNSPDGIIWFGTNKGLSQFDGETWTSYVGDEISGIGELYLSNDPHGVLWAGTFDGVLSYDGKIWRVYPPEVGLAGGTIRSIAETPDGFLWFGSLQAGLSSYLPDSFTTQGSEAEGIREYKTIDVQIIHTTTGSPSEGYQGPEFLQLGDYQMEWSDSNETSGYLLFRDHQTMLSIWEFRPSDKTEISQVELYEVQAPFYGRSVPAGETAFGKDWGDSTIRVSVGEIVLARIYNKWDIVYILKIADIDGRTVIVDYGIVKIDP